VICSGDLYNPFILDNMPASAQGFGTTQTEALVAACEMKIYSCPICGLVQYPGPLVPYYREVIRSTRLSPPMLEFRKYQFQELSARCEAENVFELGAGAGEYLDVFKQLGVKTFGIEGSKKLASSARNAGHSVLDGFLPETDLTPYVEPDSFDLLTSFNFIEHLPDPIVTLRSLNSILKSSGHALLEVPNFDMISEFGLFNEFIPDHRSYFTLDSFQLLLRLSGFKVLKIDSVWDNYILSAIVQKRSSTNWTFYEQVRRSLDEEIEKFFKGSPKSENVIWSAGHQSLATISNLELSGLICGVIDSSPNKQDTFAPASGLPIVSPDVLSKGKIRRVLLAAAGFNPEIASNIKEKYGTNIKLGFLNKGTVEVE
jgi:SAM-dependent methyltransferase